MSGSKLPPTQLAPWLWLGRHKDAKNKEWMVAHGITHVINCLDEARGPHPEVRPRLKKYVYLRSHDQSRYKLFHNAAHNSVPGPATNWELVQEVLDDARLHGGVALIYCMAGLNRSATLAAAYLAVRQGQSIEKVAQGIKSRRKGALSNPGFIEQLARLLHQDCVE